MCNYNRVIVIIRILNIRDHVWSGWVPRTDFREMRIIHTWLESDMRTGTDRNRNWPLYVAGPESTARLRWRVRSRTNEAVPRTSRLVLVCGAEGETSFWQQHKLTVFLPF